MGFLVVRQNFQEALWTLKRPGGNVRLPALGMCCGLSAGCLLALLQVRKMRIQENA